MKKIAITTGDPAGVGPEIISKVLRFSILSKNIIYIVFGRLKNYEDGNAFTKINSVEQAKTGGRVYHIRIDDKRVKSGKPSRISGQIALTILREFIKYHHYFDAVVNGPISKSKIRLSEKNFIGHTEYFAQNTASKTVVMSFSGKAFNLALLTTHLPIGEVEQALSSDEVLDKLQLIIKHSNDFAQKPKIAMLATNPHGGEDGAFGSIDGKIEKILNTINKNKKVIWGPFPADTFFSHQMGDFNIVVSMYHDQGLIPFKMANQNSGVNITLGLPFYRCSVDHGTAFDIAGKGLANTNSFSLALALAEEKLGAKQTSLFCYKAFADVYDEYMSFVKYKRWKKTISTIFRKTNKQNLPKTMLDLACGTGVIANLFAEDGVEVDAIDISPFMLEKAAKKFSNVRFYCRDILEFISTKRYEMATLTFDSFNYLKDLQQVDKLLKNVYESLLRGGIFVFDVSTKKNSTQNFDGVVDIWENKNRFLTMRSDYKNGVQTTEIDIFKKSNYFYNHQKEIHNQTIFTISEIIKQIEKSSFQKYWIFDFEGEINQIKDIDNNYLRVFFVLKKNGEYK